MEVCDVLDLRRDAKTRQGKSFEMRPGTRWEDIVKMNTG